MCGYCRNRVVMDDDDTDNYLQCPYCGEISRIKREEKYYRF